MQSDNNQSRSEILTAIGEKLKNAREAKGLTLDQVNKKTRIHGSVLRALEAGSADSMLNTAYVKSFLKEYASFLGLDPKEIIHAYLNASKELQKTEYLPSVASVVKEPSSVGDKEDESTTGSLGALVMSIIIGITLVAGVFFLGKAAVKVFTKPRPPGTAAARAARVTSQVNNTKKDAKYVRSKNTKRRVKSDKSGSGSAAQNELLKLVIKVKTPCLIQLSADGDLIFKRVLESGTEETFTAKESFTFYVSKAEAVNMTLNGKSVALPGKGVIREARITRKGLSFK